MTISGAARRPRISVCIPTYNGAPHLSEALECVNEQTFDDFEVVIVDDCSTDATAAIAEQYVAGEPRARLIRNTVRAGSSARNANRCIEESSGEWIKFLFQDDLMSPDCLEKMLDATGRGPFVMAHHDYVFSHDTPEEVRGYYETLPTLGAELPGTFAEPDDVCAAIMRNPWINFIGPTSSSLIHRECFATYGPLHGEIIYFPDLELWMRVGTNAGIAIVPEQLTTFRVHGGSTSARIRRDPLKAFRGDLDWLRLGRLIAEAPEYRRLREFARRWDPPFDAAAALRAEIIAVRWDAIDAKYRRRDRRFLREFNDLCDRDPSIRAVVRDYETSRSPWTRVKEFLKMRISAPSRFDD